MATEAKKARLQNQREKEKCRIDDFCAEYRIEMRQINEYQIRLNERLDVYPTSKKYCILDRYDKTRWGQYQNVKELLTILR